MARGRRLLPMRTCALLGLGLLAAQLYLALRFVSLEAGAPTGTGRGLQPPDEEEPGSVRRSDARVDSKVVPSAAAELWKAAGCEATSRDALSALQRAASSQCRAKIAATACAAQAGTLHPPRLSSSCPRDSTGRAALGCFRDRADFRLLPGYYADYKETNEPDFCLDMCLQSGFPYAGVQYSTECFCGENPPPSASKVADTSCNMKCPGDARQLCGGYFMMNIYQTGAVKFNAQIAATATDSDTVPVRIVFLLTLNGRASRQVRRLMNALYDKKHYFYVHVDARQDYLYRELLSLEREHRNVRLMRGRFSTIWGGASLLEMLLAAMRELLVSDWKWNFVINLSESDFPVKSVEKLEEFLSANKGRNFVKSHGREVQRFIQKQGLDKTFVECDAHMWRIGDRKLPWGLQIDGGSDWIALDRKFVSYVASKERDDLVEGLLGVFKYTLLPAESFFHTVLRNSEFCDTYVDNNLHITNWKRKLGCKCQYKHVVDWCGCSPNDFRLEDWPRLQASEQRQLFFARKFEPIVNQAIILRVEQWIKGLDQEQVINVDAYWQNIYHYADFSPRADDSLLTVVSSVTRRNSKMLLDEGCLIKPGIVNEVTSYHYTDTYKGSLILHEARMNNFGSVVIETWFKYQHFLQVNRSAKLYERLRILAVSTEYDQKEQVFRNLIRAMGPYSEPSLMYHFIPTLEETITASNVTFLWLDPVGDVAEVSEAIVFEGNVVNFIKPAFKVPLLPGVWTVKLLEGKTLVAVTRFLVIPLQFYNGSKISKREAKLAHGNFVTAYKDFTSQEFLFKSFLLPNKDKLAAKSKSELNSVRFGSDLKEWIDSLILQFYSVLGTCVSSKNVESVQCGKITLMPCHMTTWSSLAPDPKSFEGKMKKFAMKNNFSINGV